jgi:hypothetical protein
MSDTGGPAFPVVIDMGLTVDWSKGMTLRDYFAAKAMQGLMDAAMPIPLPPVQRPRRQWA